MKHRARTQAGRARKAVPRTRAELLAEVRRLRRALAAQPPRYRLDFENEEP